MFSAIEGRWSVPLLLALFAIAIAPPSARSAACSNEAFRSGPSAALPDCRAYEQVSPVDKNGADVETAPAMGAIDGNRLFFVSRGSFAGQPTSLSAEGSPYLSTRGGAGWATKGIALPNGQFSFGSDGYQGFNPDMSKGIITWQENTRFGPYDPQAQSNFNQYVFDSAAGSFSLANGTRSSMRNDEGFVWGSEDFGMVALNTVYPLTGECEPGETCAYESREGSVQLASILPNGDPVEGAAGNQIFPNQPFTCNFERAVSADGSRLFFTSLSGERALYVRENGAKTTLISASARTLPGGETGNGVNYQSAEVAHGDKVLFTTKNSLVDGDGNSTNDLYIYDFTKPAGHRLALISGSQETEAPQGASVNGGSGGCSGLAAASEDLRRVYFVADNQIVAGAPTAPGPKLFLWDDTGSTPRLVYIATLRLEDVGVWGAPAIAIRSGGNPRQSRSSTDGRYLAFISTASLTGFDDEGKQQLYRFDAVSGDLECLTCVRNALPADGAVDFQSSRAQTQPINHLPQNVSDRGQVFFQTARGLLATDSNGRRDVYMYDGQLHLISSGSGNADSSFIDATPSGSDVFFTTRDRLVGWDKDGNVDAYDARVGGGFPEPGFVPPACEGETCLAPAVAPNDPTPASSVFNGEGNVSSSRVRPCPRGKARKQGKCGRKKPNAKLRRNQRDIVRHGPGPEHKKWG